MENGSEHINEDNRPLSARLDAYIANLASIKSQLQNLIGLVDSAGRDTTELRGMVRLQTEIINDLTKVLNGEKLASFRIEVEIR